MFEFLKNLFYKEKENSKYFLGMKLSNWYYLGYSVIWYTNKEGKKTESCYIYISLLTKKII